MGMFPKVSPLAQGPAVDPLHFDMNGETVGHVPIGEHGPRPDIRLGQPVHHGHRPTLGDPGGAFGHQVWM